MPTENGNARFERIEATLEAVVNSQKNLLSSQVILTDRFDQILVSVDTLARHALATDARLDRLVEAQLKTEQHVEQLAKRVDQLADRVDQFADQLAQFQAQTGWRIDNLVSAIGELTRRLPPAA